MKFELPMYNGEVNVEKVHNWVFQLEVYYRVQNLQDDDTNIQLASFTLEVSALVWWEAKTQDEIKKNGNISISWYNFIVVIKIQFYPLAYMQKDIMNWKNFRQLKGQNVQEYTQ